ncbi:MAG: ATP-binding protein [bacterium]
MKLGIRGKLFAVSVGLIVAVVLASGLVLERELRSWLEGRLETELHLMASQAAVAIDASHSPITIEGLDPLADKLGAAIGARVTVIAHDGTVLGDSDLAPEQVRTVENHANRPELRAATARGLGASRRYSATIHTDLLYLAVPFGDGAGFVRVALPLHEVSSVVTRLRWLLLVAGAAGLAVAVGMSALASHWATRTVRDLVASAGAIAAGEKGARIAITSRDELGGLGGSLNRLAEQLERTVAALADERDRIQGVLEGMNEAVLAIDANGLVTLMNRAALELAGRERVPTGRPLIELLRVPALDDAVTAARAGGVPAPVEFQAGGERPRTILARIAGQPGGGCVVVFHDVTEIRRLEKVRSDFVANVSHELRTPVAAILANAETLAGGALDDRERAPEFLEAMVRNAARLGRIIDDLLDLSKIEAGAYPLAPQEVNVAELACAALALLADAARAKQITLAWDESCPDSLTAWADEHALEDVLGNLLDNAVKYTPAGGHVTMTARAQGEHVRIEVSDDGPGIPPHQRTRVFERFYRVDAGRSREMGGTGLGLAIVKHLVDAMGGRVGVDPVDPHGSRFWVLLPARAATGRNA